MKFWTPGIDPRRVTRRMPDGSIETATTWKRGPVLCNVTAAGVAQLLWRMVTILPQQWREARALARAYDRIEK